MKTILTIIVLVTVFVHQMKCFYVGDEPEPGQADERNLLDKVKDGLGAVKQTVESTYHVAKCKLHQVGNKIHAHSHTVDPCVGENPEFPRTNQDPSYYKINPQDNGNGHDHAAPHDENAHGHDNADPHDNGNAHGHDNAATHDNGNAHNNGVSYGNGDDAGSQGGEPGGRRLPNADTDIKDYDVEENNIVPQIRTGKRIITRANCPENYVADKKGVCRERF